MIRRPIPEAKDNDFRSDKKESSVLKQISSSMPTFFNKSNVPIDVLASDGRINDSDYKCYSQRITESKFYLVALETRSFLNQVLLSSDKLANIITGMGNFISKIDSCISRIPVNPEILDLFKEGLLSHVLLKIHQT